MYINMCIYIYIHNYIHIHIIPLYTHHLAIIFHIPAVGTPPRHERGIHPLTVPDEAAAAGKVLVEAKCGFYNQWIGVRENLNRKL